MLPATAKMNVGRIAGVLALILALFAAPFAADAQQAGKVYRVDLIAATPPVSELAGPDPVNPTTRAFVQGLRALGYVEGQNPLLERRSAEGRYERFGDIVAELVRLKADVIVTHSNQAARAAKAVTTTVPIVMEPAATPWARGSCRASRDPAATSRGSRPWSGRRSRRNTCNS